MCLLNLLPLSFFPASDSCALMKFRQPSGHLWSISSIISWGLRKNKVVLKCNMHSLKSSVDNSKGIFCFCHWHYLDFFGMAAGFLFLRLSLCSLARRASSCFILWNNKKGILYVCLLHNNATVRILKLKKLRTSPGPSFGDCCAELSPEPQPVLWCLHLTLLSLLRSPLSFPPFQQLSLESPLSFPV